ncbi:hypothetical protein PCE1_001918 [Barthelona sp. PCE]
MRNFSFISWLKQPYRTPNLTITSVASMEIDADMHQNMFVGSLEGQLMRFVDKRRDDMHNFKAEIHKLRIFADRFLYVHSGGSFYVGTIAIESSQMPFANVPVEGQVKCFDMHTFMFNDKERCIIHLATNRGVYVLDDAAQIIAYYSFNGCSVFIDSCLDILSISPTRCVLAFQGEKFYLFEHEFCLDNEADLHQIIADIHVSRYPISYTPSPPHVRYLFDHGSPSGNNNRCLLTKHKEGFMFVRNGIIFSYDGNGEPLSSLDDLPIAVDPHATKIFSNDFLLFITSSNAPHFSLYFPKIYNNTEIDKRMFQMVSSFSSFDIKSLDACQSFPKGVSRLCLGVGETVVLGTVANVKDIFTDMQARLSEIDNAFVMLREFHHELVDIFSTNKVNVAVCELLSKLHLKKAELLYGIKKNPEAIDCLLQAKIGWTDIKSFRLIRDTLEMVDNKVSIKSKTKHRLTFTDMERDSLKELRRTLEGCEQYLLEFKDIATRMAKQSSDAQSFKELIDCFSVVFDLYNVDIENFFVQFMIANNHILASSFANIEELQEFFTLETAKSYPATMLGNILYSINEQLSTIDEVRLNVEYISSYKNLFASLSSLKHLSEEAILTFLDKHNINTIFISYALHRASTTNGFANRAIQKSLKAISDYKTMNKPPHDKDTFKRDVTLLFQPIDATDDTVQALVDFCKVELQDRIQVLFYVCGFFAPIYHDSSNHLMDSGDIIEYLLTSTNNATFEELISNRRLSSDLGFIAGFFHVINEFIESKTVTELDRKRGVHRKDRRDEAFDLVSSLMKKFRIYLGKVMDDLRDYNNAKTNVDVMENLQHVIKALPYNLMPFSQFVEHVQVLRDHVQVYLSCFYSPRIVTSLSSKIEMNDLLMQFNREEFPAKHREEIRMIFLESLAYSVDIDIVVKPVFNALLEAYLNKLDKNGYEPMINPEFSEECNITDEDLVDRLLPPGVEPRFGRLRWKIYTLLNRIPHDYLRAIKPTFSSHPIREKLPLEHAFLLTRLGDFSGAFRLLIQHNCVKMAFDLLKLYPDSDAIMTLVIQFLKSDSTAFHELGCSLIWKWRDSIDVRRLLDELPTDIKLGSMYAYLKWILESTNSTRNDYITKKSFLERKRAMLLAKRNDLISRPIVVEYSTMCHHCGNSIGTSAFVYDKGQILHSYCASKQMKNRK